MMISMDEESMRGGQLVSGHRRWTRHSEKGVMIYRESRKSRKHGNHGNRDFRPKAVIFQNAVNAVLPCFLLKCRGFTVFLQEYVVFYQHKLKFIVWFWHKNVFCFASATKVRVLC